MAFAQKFQTLIFKSEGEGEPKWENGPVILLTKNSIAHVVIPGDEAASTSIRLNDGSTVRVSQDLDYILSFLNGA